MRVSLSIISLILLAGCVFVASGCSLGIVDEKKSTTVPAYPPVDPAMVAVVTAKPEQPFIVLGNLSLDHVEDYDVQYARDQMRASAAKLGADALWIKSEISTPVTSLEIRSLVDLKGVAIRYK